MILQVSFVPWATAVIAISCPVVVSIIWYFLRKFLRKWDEREAKRELYYIKVDCMIVGLKKMNGTMSAKFEQEFDKEFENRTNDIDLLNKINHG